MDAKKPFVYVVFPDGRKRGLAKRPSLQPTSKTNSVLCEKGTQTSDIDTVPMKACNETKTEQKCLKCLLDKSMSDFNKNQRMCKGCTRIYHEWRKLNKEHIDKVNKDLKQSRDEFFAKHLSLNQQPDEIVKESE